MTEAERQREAQTQQRMEQTRVAREAIVAHLGIPWGRGMPAASGKMDCPVCGSPGALHFRRSAVNGHIHAHCVTASCVSWME